LQSDEIIPASLYNFQYSDTGTDCECLQQSARVAELADAPDLGSGG
jgi:hypothetical protein